MTYQEKYAPFFERLSQYSNLSLLQQVFYEEDITSRIKKLFLEEKYVPTREDIKFVKNEYIREKDGDTGKDSILSHLSFIVFYSQKEMVCEFIKRKLRVRSDSNSFL